MMKTKLLIAIVFVGSGIILAIMSLKDIFYMGINSFNAMLLMLSCVLMICGVLFKYVGELDEIKRVLGIDQELLKKGDEEIKSLRRGKGKEASGWRIRDMEQRLKELEERVK